MHVYYIADGPYEESPNHDAWVFDNVHIVISIWSLALAYRYYYSDVLFRPIFCGGMHMGIHIYVHITFETPLEKSMMTMVADMNWNKVVSNVCAGFWFPLCDKQKRWKCLKRPNPSILHHTANMTLLLVI